jgi:hypothetical protein
MNVILKLIAILLLLVNGIGALYGGWSLIGNPGGEKLQLSLSYLDNTPFNDYLIPGLILFLTNGISSLIVVAAIFFSYRHAAKLVIAQGAILTGWIIIQMIMIQVIYWLHWVLGGIGLALIGTGYLLNRLKTDKSI